MWAIPLLGFCIAAVLGAGVALLAALVPFALQYLFPLGIFVLPGVLLRHVIPAPIPDTVEWMILFNAVGWGLPTGAILLVREYRRERAEVERRKHRCHRCGYDLALLTSARCPECGEPIRPPEPTQGRIP